MVPGGVGAGGGKGLKECYCSSRRGEEGAERGDISDALLILF